MKLSTSNKVMYFAVIPLALMAVASSLADDRDAARLLWPAVCFAQTIAMIARTGERQP